MANRIIWRLNQKQRFRKKYKKKVQSAGAGSKNGKQRGRQLVYLTLPNLSAPENAGLLKLKQDPEECTAT
jgi:hypothetical protein